MSTGLIHRPARTTRPPAAPGARTIEAPPNLPEGKGGNIAMSLLPVAGVMSSVVMMTVVRNSQFAALGALTWSRHRSTASTHPGRASVGRA